jgi:SagB-type dehydrogenase family enzyme
MKILLTFAGIILMSGILLAEEPQSVALPAPVTEGGKPLMQCLNERHTTREFSSDAVNSQVLSNLLWAAFGINREDGRRTAPSAMNNQETDIYVFLPEGVHLYDAKAHSLKQVLAGDHRAAAGGQEFVKDAPINLMYVADLSKMGDMSDADKALYSAADVGFIAENAYLYCTSDGMNCVVRGWVDREAVAKLLNLRPDQKVILAQTVGYPRK